MAEKITIRAPGSLEIADIKRYERHVRGLILLVGRELVSSSTGEEDEDAREVKKALFVSWNSLPGLRGDDALRSLFAPTTTTTTTIVSPWYKSTLEGCCRKLNDMVVKAEVDPRAENTQESMMALMDRMWTLSAVKKDEEETASILKRTHAVANLETLVAKFLTPSRDAPLLSKCTRLLDLWKNRIVPYHNC